MSGDTPTVHPASFVGDTIEEFKKLPTWGKVLAVALGAVGAYVVYSSITGKSSSSQTASSATPSGVSASGTTSSSPTDSQAFPSVSSGDTSVPYIPNNVNPIYGPQGQLEAYQSVPSSTTTTPSSTTATTPSSTTATTPSSTTASSPTGYLGLLGPNVAVDFNNSTYTNAQGQQVAIPIATGDKLVQGSQNRVWYTDSGGQHLLTSGVGPAIDPTTNKPMGGGGKSVQSGLRTYTVQYGDNLHSVASQLKIKGGLPAWLDHNGWPRAFFHGQELKVPPHD